MLVFNHEYLWDQKKTSTHTHTHLYCTSLPLMWKKRWQKIWRWSVFYCWASWQRETGNNIEFWGPLRTVLIHFHAIWLTTEVTLKCIAHIHSLSAGLSHRRPSVMREDLLRESEPLFFHVLFFFFMLHAHCLANRSENRMQGTGNSARRNFLSKQSMICKLACCCCRIHLRWHNSWIWLDVRHITLLGWEGKGAGERNVKMCVIFLKSLFQSGARAVKMCTGLSAFLHWAASWYFTFSLFFSQPFHRPSTSSCLFFSLPLTPSLCHRFFFSPSSALSLSLR